MMYAKTSYTKLFLKTSLLLPLLAIATLCFTKTLMAQDTMPPGKPTTPLQNTPDNTVMRSQTIGYNEKGLSEEGLQEYAAIIKKCKASANKGKSVFTNYISEQEKARLIELFKQMSIQQQNTQELFFIAPLPPMPKSRPSMEQFKAFQNGHLYGVWVDDQKIANAALSKYVYSDFDQYFISKLYGAAKKNKTYQYQVNLMTKAFYAKYVKDEIAETESGMVLMGVRRFK